MLKINEPETKKVPPATHANDTFVTRSTMFCLWQNSDTDMDIIAEFHQAVNENERF